MIRSGKCSEGAERDRDVVGTPSQGQRLDGLDVARGICILLVVLLHVSMLLPAPPAIYRLNWLWTTIRMPTMMLVSGLLAPQLIGGAGKIARRASRYTWLLAVWAPLSAVYKVIDGEQVQLGEIISNIVMPHTEVWFVWALALQTLTLPLVRRLNRWVLVISLLAVASLVIKSDEIGFSFIQIQKYAVYFYIGALFRPEMVRFIQMLSPGRTLMIAAAFVLAHMMDHWFLYGRQVDVTIPIQGLCGSLVIIGCKEMPFAATVKTGLAMLGRNTIAIYFCHMPVVFAASALAMRVGGLGASTFMVVATVLIAVAFSLGLQRVLVAMGLPWAFEPPHWFDFGRIVAAAQRHRARYGDRAARGPGRLALFNRHPPS